MTSGAIAAASVRGIVCPGPEGVQSRLQNNIHAAMGNFAQLSLPVGQSDSRGNNQLWLQEW
jgi:hypothetical protein